MLNECGCPYGSCSCDVVQAPPNPTHFWKIRRLSDGLFSTGGHWPRFTKKGKIWTSLGHIRTHLGNLDVARLDVCDWEIVEHLVYEGAKRPAISYFKETMEAKKKLRLTEDERRAKEDRKRKEAEYERLKQELGK